MNLKKICEEKIIPVKEFSEIFNEKIEKNFYLNKNDYLICPFYIKGDVSNKFFSIEKIREVNFIDKGDFITEEGTFGLINNNVFLRLNKNHNCVLEGLFLDKEKPKNPIYIVLKNYLKNFR